MLLKSIRTAQYPLVAEFVFNYNDTMVDVVGVPQDYGASAIRTNAVFETIPLPGNAIVVGGDITVDVPYVGPTTATIGVGDMNALNRYATAVDMKTAARTALTLTGYRGSGENLRFTINTTVAVATAGKVSVRAAYIVTGRANENCIT